MDSFTCLENKLDLEPRLGPRPALTWRAQEQRCDPGETVSIFLQLSHCTQHDVHFPLLMCGTD